ncbi:MAG: N-acetylmuramoyl-L-alanine amidase [Rhizobiaceae bacterium]|nr:N-acetylmuramoyl-L-alanine amidase [Rhizobiaceae bacterium]MCV0406554.1 N-acetylmuramoyl-L-alanine amidase [Rhizobiaceae bacterium]
MTGFGADFAGAEVRVSPNFGPRGEGAGLELLILHYTGMETGEAAEAWLCDPASGVSSHYLVHEDGRVVQMVRESDRAWHAGAGSWKGEGDVNSRSIGIEIVNGGHAYGLPDFPDVQIMAVIGLCRDICQRRAIRPEGVLAHSDIAPGRKVDPGEMFPWERLAEAGVGLIAAPKPCEGAEPCREGAEGPAVERLQSMLALHGYGVEIDGRFDARTRIVVEAFQRHFRRSRVDGVADAETLGLLGGLLAATAG